MHDLMFSGGKVYQDGRFVEANLYIDGEKIAAITPERKAAKRQIDCLGLLILPGLIDPHVHMELDLGFTTSSDDFYKGSVEAVKGGVTTIIDFLAPIGHESQLDEAFRSRLDLAEKSVADYAMHATLGSFQGDVNKLIPAVKAKGMSSIKVFTTYSESDRMVPPQILHELLDREIVTMVHAEEDRLVNADWPDISTYEASRPLEAELGALNHLLANLGKGTLYVVHVSSGSGVELLAGRDRVIIESCPHYFYLSKEQFKGAFGGLYLLAPPLRSEEEKASLNKNFESVYTIGTDHCPFPKSEKLASRNASAIPKGIGSIRYSFLLMYSKFGEPVIEKMSSHVAKVFQLKDKGRLAPGYDADLFILDPQGETVVKTGSESEDYSVYEGLRLKGRIESTMIRGHFVMEAGEVICAKGRYIRSDGHESNC